MNTLMKKVHFVLLALTTLAVTIEAGQSRYERRQAAARQQQAMSDVADDVKVDVDIVNARQETTALQGVLDNAISLAEGECQTAAQLKTAKTELKKHMGTLLTTDKKLHRAIEPYVRVILTKQLSVTNAAEVKKALTNMQALLPVLEASKIKGKAVVTAVDNINSINDAPASPAQKERMSAQALANLNAEDAKATKIGTYSRIKNYAFNKDISLLRRTLTIMAGAAVTGVVAYGGYKVGQSAYAGTLGADAKDFYNAMTYENAKDLITNLPSNAYSAVTAAPGQIWEGVKAAPGATYRAAMAAPGATYRAVTSAPSAVYSAGARAAGTVGGWGSSMWNKMPSFGKQAVTTVTVSTLANAATNAANNTVTSAQELLNQNPNNPLVREVVQNAVHTANATGEVADLTDAATQGNMEQ